AGTRRPAASAGHPRSAPPSGTCRRGRPATRARRRRPAMPGPAPGGGRSSLPGACCGPSSCLRCSVVRALGLAFRVLDVVLLAAVDRLVLLAFDLEDAQRALVEGAEQAVVDQHEVAGHVGLELDDGRATGR